jgi:hypothetical protein
MIRALQVLFAIDEPNPFWSETEVNIATDYTKWLAEEDSDDPIVIKAEIEVDATRDAGLFQFLATYLALDE